MKANELMIGDWVLFNGNSKKVTSLLVTDLGVDQIYVFGKSCQVATISEYIEPIPMTAEILEKNGLEKSSITDYKWSALYEGNRLPDMWEDTNKHYLMMIGLIDVNINYVHELQHALKLCGIDKNIEL